ncbi:carbohydrate-binding protein [Streptomyces europaeiscabiei]|nr:carbohydrate-binding protein [Streptomyces europaeiscabiei]MDX2758441.1 carbohydrate-binding protein [Streptomyces europaeiscabiei]MDX2769799.1 carbohydrate-binding protein [Streptomyces europaeiscabiei]
MPAQGNSFTNHAGIVDFQGNSYFFYQNAALPGGGGFTRSVAVEKFSYNADGTIPTINMTNTGAPQLGTLNPYVRQEAETIAWGSGIETEWTSDGGMNVGWIENGDYIKVKGAAFGSGAASFTARGASATSGGTVELRLGSPSGTVVGRCSVPNTGGWQAWTTVTCPRLCQHLPRLLRQLEPGTPATLHTALTARRLHPPPHRPRMHPRQLRPRPHMRRRDDVVRPAPHSGGGGGAQLLPHHHAGEDSSLVLRRDAGYFPLPRFLVRGPGRSRLAGIGRGALTQGRVVNVFAGHTRGVGVHAVAA